MSIIEIHRFPASDAFIADQGIAKHPLDILKGLKGQVKRYYGLQVEDKKTGYFVLVWESYEHLADLKNDSSYPAFIDAFRPLHIEGPQSRIHVHYNGDTTPEEVASMVGERKKAIGVIWTKLKSAKGLHGIVPGEIRGDPDTITAALGWDSVDAHVQAIAPQEIISAVDDFMRVASPETPHAKLTRHE